MRNPYSLLAPLCVHKRLARGILIAFSHSFFFASIELILRWLAGMKNGYRHVVFYFCNKVYSIPNSF